MRICNLASGSKGNSTYIETKNHKILIDIGMSCVQIEKKLNEIGVDPKDINLVLITHAHVDHIKGLSVFNKKYMPQIYVSEKILNEANLENFQYNRVTDLKNIADLKIKDINLSHDVKDIKGFTIEEENSSMVYITDTGYISEINFEYITNKNLYIFESNHDIPMLMNNPNYPHHTKIRILGDKGHLSNKDSAYYLTKIIGENTKYIVLAHLSEQNNTEELALSSLETALKEKTNYDPKIIIAKQDLVGDILEI